MALSRQEKALLARFGGNLRRVWVAAKLTQAKLAERVDLELRTVQKFEAGEINVPPETTNLLRLSRSLAAAMPGTLSPKSG